MMSENINNILFILNKIERRTNMKRMIKFGIMSMFCIVVLNILSTVANCSDLKNFYWKEPITEIQKVYNLSNEKYLFDEKTTVYKIDLKEPLYDNMKEWGYNLYFCNQELYGITIDYSTYKNLSYNEFIDVINKDLGKPLFNNGIECIWRNDKNTVIFKDCGGIYKLFIFSTQLLNEHEDISRDINYKLSLSSNIATGEQSYINLSLKYPLVYLENKGVQEKINRSISNYVYNFKSKYDNGDFINGRMRYDIKYEDEEYISLILTFYEYTGGAHGSLYGKAIVYSKKTGDIIPLENFVKIKSVNDLNTIFILRYDENMFLLNKDSNIKRISKDYYLGGDGDIYLMYQPYELAGFGYGLMSIKINAEMVDYFNRKNK